MADEIIKKINRLINIPKCNNQEYTRKSIKEVLRQEIIKTQNGLCYLCNAKTTFPMVHHIIPQEESIKENLVMICPSCHEFIHNILHSYLGYKKHVRRGAWN